MGIVPPKKTKGVTGEWPRQETKQTEMKTNQSITVTKNWKIDSTN